MAFIKCATPHIFLWLYLKQDMRYAYWHSNIDLLIWLCISVSYDIAKSIFVQWLPGPLVILYGRITVALLKMFTLQIIKSQRYESAVLLSLLMIFHSSVIQTDSFTVGTMALSYCTIYSLPQSVLVIESLATLSPIES